MGKTKEKRTKRRNQILKMTGLSPLFWSVIEDREYYLIVKHIVSGTVRHIHK